MRNLPCLLGQRQYSIAGIAELQDEWEYSILSVDEIDLQVVQ